MTGVVEQVNISRGGVPKSAIPEGHVTRTGIQGDSWAHPRFHGGPRQAVLLIAEEVILSLSRRGFPVFPGALGENITMRGIDPRWMRLGQLWRLGTATVELTKVRVPCRTIEVYGEGIGREIYDAQVKAGDTSSPRWGWSGMYAAVVDEGFVRPGDALTLLAETA